MTARDETARDNRRSLRALMAAELPRGLMRHIDRVVATAEPLARRHSLDVETALLMAQAHDLRRATPEPELLAEAERRGLLVVEAERAAPVLLHGPLGALELEERGWVLDPVVLHAVRFHTTGHPDLTAEGWAMFIADKVEPHKRKRWPALGTVAELAGRSLEAAALAYLDLLHAQTVERGWAEHPDAEATREALRARVGRTGPDQR